MTSTALAMAFVFGMTAGIARAIYVSKMAELRERLTVAIGFNAEYFVLSPENTKRVLTAMFVRDPQLFVDAAKEVSKKGIADDSRKC